MALSKRVYIDPLTGVYNRAFLEDKILEILQNAEEEGRVLQIVMFDIDYFKRINDLYGHVLGDQVLKEFAEFLKNSLRAGDILIRYGGDEFLAILNNLDYSDGIKVVERIVESCRVQEFAKLKITLSAGIASFPKHADKWENLFELVDKSLYFAKRTGRDRVGVLQNVGRAIIPTYDIIGRIEEIERIIRFIEGSTNTKVVHIIGEIGVGKTRLVKEVLNYPQLKNFEQFHVVLSPSTRSIVFYPIRYLIRSLRQKDKSVLKELPSVLLSEIYKLNPPEGEELGEIFYVDKFKLFEAVKEFLKLYSEKISPLVVFLDDAHWLDDYSLELLSYLFRSEDTKNVVLIFSTRIEEMRENLIRKFFGFSKNDYFELHLKPLEKEDLRQLSVKVFGQTPPNFFVDFLYNKSGGNPYIAYELIKSLIDSGGIFWNGEAWEFKKDFDLDVPSSLIVFTEMKIASLEGVDLDVLEYIAVYGKPVDIDLLSEFTGLRTSELIPIIEKLESFGLISRDFIGFYFVPEGILIEALCKRAGEKSLALIHDRIAEVLWRLTPDSVEEIAQHYYKAGDFENAFEFLLKAAEKTLEYYALKDAITYYSWALGCLQRYRKIENYEKKKAEILLKRSKLYLDIGDRKAALVDAEEAFSIALNLKDPEVEAEANKQMGIVFENMSNFFEAVQRLEYASSLFEKLRDFRGVVECTLYLGRVFQAQSKYKLSRSYFLRALELASSLNAKDLEVGVLYHLASLLSDCGELDEALPLLENALKISQNLIDKKLEMKIYNQLGVVYIEKGEIEKGLDLLQKSLELARKLFDLRTEAATCHNIGLVLFAHLGKPLEAVDYLERSSRIFHMIEDRLSESIVLSSLGTIYKSMGNYHSAKECFTKSLKIAKEIKAERLILSVSLNLANLHLDYGKFRSALPKLHSALRLSAKLGLKDFESRVLLSLGAYYYYVGDLKEAERYLINSANLAMEISQVYNLTCAYLSLMCVYLGYGDLKKTVEVANQVEKNLKELKNEVLQIDYQLLSMELDFLFGKPISLKKLSAIIERCKALGLRPRLADAMVLAGRVTARLEALEKSREYFEKAISILKKIGNAFYLARAHALYAEVLRYSGFKEEALLNYKKAYELFKNLKTDVWIKVFSIPQLK